MKALRVFVLAVSLSGPWASAQELSAPPPPPPVAAPDAMLPGPPDEAKTFTREFSTRLSFFSSEPKRRFDISLDPSQDRCKTPCSLRVRSGDFQISVKRDDGYTLTEEHFIPPGESHMVIRSFSPPMVTTGAVLMGLSSTLVVAMIVFTAIFPYGIAAWLLTMLLPAAVLGIPGVVLTAVGAHRQTMRLLGPGEFAAGDAR